MKYTLDKSIQGLKKHTSPKVIAIILFSQKKKRKEFNYYF